VVVVEESEKEEQKEEGGVRDIEEDEKGDAEKGKDE
jgi:hypothetical protein